MWVIGNIFFHWHGDPMALLRSGWLRQWACTKTHHVIQSCPNPVLKGLNLAGFYSGHEERRYPSLEIIDTHFLPGHFVLKLNCYIFWLKLPIWVTQPNFLFISETIKFASLKILHCLLKLSSWLDRSAQVKWFLEGKKSSRLASFHASNLMCKKKKPIKVWLTRSVISLSFKWAGSQWNTRISNL